MKKIVIHCRVDRSPRNNGLIGFRELYNLLSSTPINEELKGLVGLDRESRGAPVKRKAPAKVNNTDLILTVRRDLVDMRDLILNNAPRRGLLKRVDYTIDQLDNILGEM